MPVNIVNIAIPQGEDVDIQVTFTDNLGAPVNDTGALYRMTAKMFYTDADPGVFSVTSHQSAPGQALLIIPATSTAGLKLFPQALYYEIQVTETSGRITKLQQGLLSIKTAVTLESP